MIKRKKPLSRVPKRQPERRVGRVSGTVRLSGKAMEKLRSDCWTRDFGNCQECGGFTFWTPRFEGDPFAYDMAHVKSRGAGGGDTLDNLKTMHHSCHMAEHTKGLNR